MLLKPKYPNRYCWFMSCNSSYLKFNDWKYACVTRYGDTGVIPIFVIVKTIYMMLSLVHGRREQSLRY